MALLVVGVEEEIDPMLDPVLEKQFIIKGKKKFVNVSDKVMDYDDNFMMYFITRLPNPNFSPELQAKTTVVDFTVTQKGPRGAAARQGHRQGAARARGAAHPGAAGGQLQHE